MLQHRQISWAARPGCVQGCRQLTGSRVNRAVTRVLCVQSKASSTAKDSAKSSVETGLKLFSDGNYRDALQCFESAMQAEPSDDEARAALYNSACAHAKLKQWQPATDAVRKAVNDYQLRLTVAVKDADLEQLRETREWLDALDTMKGGLSSRSVAGLRAEAKAPFRLARILAFQGLFAGAAIGLVVSSSRLFAALTGQAGAPDTIETARNFGINLAGAVLLGFLLRRDLASQSKDRRTVEREEAFARLQVSIGDRVLPIAAFRGSTRPVLIVGSKGHIARAMRAAEPFKPQLRQRGISLITLQTDELDSNSQLDALKKEFGRREKTSKESRQPAASSKGFGAPAVSKDEALKAKASKSETDRWQLALHDKQEWLQWLAQQRREAAAEGDTVYVQGYDVYTQVQLDGTVRASGGGPPPWQRFVNDLPEVDSLQTRLTDGLGRV